jgi:hypothetical protein
MPDATMGISNVVSDPFDSAEWADKIAGMLRNPAAHRPSAADIARIKAFYDPTRVGGEYIVALTGARPVTAQREET